MSNTLQIRKKGVITLPMDLRRQYSLDEGDLLTLVDLGEGAFILVPQVSQTAAWGDRVARTLAEENVSLDDMLLVLDEERERYYQEHYVEE
jgi:bifunctional DNA-binding transcriptional regulator/antitoxin component of YhaV-PrlF toxin-antitoxin module